MVPFWCYYALFAVLFFVPMLCVGSCKREAVQAEVDRANAVSRFFRSGGWLEASDAEQEYAKWVLLGIAGSLFMAFPAWLAALVHVHAREKTAARDELQRIRMQARADEENLAKLERDSLRQEDSDRRAQSRQQLVALLGSIDQFVRVLEGERDEGRRIVALQGAQAVVSSIESKLMAGEISQEAIADVQQNAQETRFDLVRIGLRDDRLARDLRRVFRLSEQPEGG